jgi:hypothetical protein
VLEDDMSTSSENDLTPGQWVCLETGSTMAMLGQYLDQCPDGSAVVRLDNGTYLRVRHKYLRVLKTTASPRLAKMVAS